MPVAAIDLYLSRNIREVYEMSQRQGLDFRILSGKFGLLRADDKMGWYDYLLTKDAVDNLARKMQGQMALDDIKEVTFFAENRERHPNWVPYYDAITKACKGFGVSLGFVEIPDK